MHGSIKMFDLAFNTADLVGKLEIQDNKLLTIP